MRQDEESFAPDAYVANLHIAAKQAKPLVVKKGELGAAVAANDIEIQCEALFLMVVRLVVKIEGSVEIRSLEFCGGSFSASRANQHKVE